VADHAVRWDAGLVHDGLRSFRFSTASFELTRDGVLAEARKAESLGYDSFVMADHLFEQMAPLTALTMVAENVGLRVGAYVLCNDFRHPVLMAKEAATVDVVTQGRFELGLGAGYVPDEYQMAGIAYEPGAVRFERLAETVQIARLAFGGERFSFEGAHYQVHDYAPYPRPVQRAGPPLLLGGGGRRLLTLAGTHADIVSILPPAAPEGGLRATHLSVDSFKQKVAVVREAALARAADIEINILVFDLVVTGDRRAAALAYLDDLEARLGFTIDGPVTADDLLDSPYVLFGTEEQVAQQLLRLREETGASYIAVFPHLMDAFQPVLTRLRES
jgi:probable F420-dependent oxidoreductase